MNTTLVELPPSRTPGALEVADTRELPDGSRIDFEYAPAGWLTKGGKMRQRDWRAYYFCPAGGERVRLPSVTTVLDCILPKPGLPSWSEARGIEGAVRAVRMGEIATDDPLDRAVEIVRTLRLGADRARDDAAQRGLSVHDLLREFMQTGAAPALRDHPVEHHGYIKALSRWLLQANLEPEVVEEMVVSPHDGYAGRTDLVARSDGFRVRYDAKTSEKCAIYESAHVQVKLYDRAAMLSGDQPADLLKVVVFAADGEYREMVCGAEDTTVEAALAWWRAVKPITSACGSANRAEKEARKPREENP